MLIKDELCRLSFFLDFVQFVLVISSDSQSFNGPWSSESQQDHYASFQEKDIYISETFSK